MMSMMLMTIIVSLIAIVTMTAASILSKKTTTDREKMSPFECGFDPLSSSRIPFSLRFFLIAIIFLIFDVEIALILPSVTVMNYSTPLAWSATAMFFIMILLMGLYHEWNQGALNWNP